MDPYERILVCVESPERDGWMLDYCAAICRVAGTKELHLLHVAVAQAATEVASVQDGVTIQSLEQFGVDFVADDPDRKVLCQVVSGSPIIEILRYALEKNIDLIVLGRPADGSAKGEDAALLARRVTMKSTCSVLILPQGSRTKADKILVPVRASECSANAVRRACQVASAIDGTVCCLNVFAPESGYSKVGTTLEEYVALLDQHARHECERLLSGIDTGGVNVVTKCVPDLSSRPVSIILGEIENESADLVVIGARGRSGAAGVLLGKVTEQLICQSPIPVMAVKKKGECLGILQALLVLAG